MKRLNLIEIETRWGYRTIELYCGDLTKVERDIDVLAVSSFWHDYSPSPKSLIGALARNCGISVLELSKSCEYDFRDSLGCWIAKVKPASKFARVACVDITGGRLEIAELIENLFVSLSILEMKGIKINNLALPVLGAGMQALDPEEMIRALLGSMKKHRDNLRDLNQVLFVEIDEQRASQLDQGINEQLGRVKLLLPRDQLFDGLRKDIGKNLDKADALAESDDGAVFRDLRRLILADQSAWFEIGIASRKVVEYVVEQVLPDNELEGVLWKNIDHLHGHRIAKWITSYMHVLRVFGNESAHKQAPDRYPSNIDQGDMLLCLFCLQRVLDFWIEFRDPKRGRSA
jgi:hypothetical protein